MALLGGTGLWSAEPIVIRAYSLPPYLDGGNGLVEVLLNRVLEGGPYAYRYEQYPLVRARYTFIADSQSLFLGSEKVFDVIGSEGYVFVPLVRLRFAFLQLTEARPITGLADLKTLRVGTLIGSAYEAFLRSAVAELQLVSDHEQNLRMLAAGRLDAVHGPDIVLLNEVNRYFPNQRQLFRFAAFDQVVRGGVFIHADQPALVAYLTARIRDLVAGPEYVRLLQKFYGSGAVSAEVKIRPEEIR